MVKLIFKNDKAGTLAKMMEHSNAHKRRKPYKNFRSLALARASSSAEETEEYGLWLVKDDRAIYLMSPTDTSFGKVVYARGYKPTQANRDKTHAVSGDDFAEFVQLTEDQMVNVVRGGSITIELNETQIAVGRVAVIFQWELPEDRDELLQRRFGAEKAMGE